MALGRACLLPPLSSACQSWHSALIVLRRGERACAAKVRLTRGRAQN